ncbi:PP2C family serine/threonine-protein phosphatase [Amycolatopsis sp. DG1A-15b]|uniref:PP2C family protein-serine/threonine phosphatase n=1 Tax=Amycolatopsis sp. DG1A-15b TaxID=3052846 RepID=UPI00255BCB7E|nr:PP2C family serine/threonine-protein phosphatase [Amycolatopsis sp. DG1A-15b]WIX92517.1 serine/threonine-protein phosphatase [Amycolatopsis sp. DG1A-15b]
MLVFGWLSQALRPQLVELRAPTTSLPLVCAVADGMGGHAAGEVASTLALTYTAQDYHEWTTADAVRAGLLAINERVYARGAADAWTTGMGTTIAGLIFQARRGICFNIGDSRVHRISDGYVEQISVDHVATEPDGAPTSRLTQSLGEPPDRRLEPHVIEFPLTGEQSRFLICTDGVTSMLRAADFRGLCRRTELDDLVMGLRDAVYEVGADDNLSLIAVDVPGAD